MIHSAMSITVLSINGGLEGMPDAADNLPPTGKLETSEYVKLTCLHLTFSK